MEIEELKKIEKNENKYICKTCTYNCCYLSDWNKHINTRKHINSQISTLKEIEELKLIENISSCEYCNKEFKTNAVLWKHKNKGICIKINYKVTEKNEIITMLLKQNSELIKGQSEMIKEHFDITPFYISNAFKTTLNIT
jgi:uncharacterized Zn-finger protein